MTDPYLGEDLVGRMLGEHYRVGARLGAGTMGVVYRVTHTLLARDFAAKVLAPSLARDPEARARFLGEVESLGRLVHPNIVTVRHFGEDHGLLYLVMDLCEGETLEALLAREGPLEPARAVPLALEILRALDAAHWEGIVHRDLKPANVMVTPGEARAGAAPRVRVLDFGLAHVRATPRASGMHDALPPAVAGTVPYMAPEQVRAERDVDARCDLFALGCVLQEMLSGRSPFARGSPLTTAMAILDQPAPPLPTDGPRAVPGALCDVVQKALAKDRRARFATAGEMAEALREAMAGGRTARGRTAARPRRVQARSWLALLFAVVLGAWGVHGIVGGGRAAQGEQTGRADRELAWRAFLDARFEATAQAAARAAASPQGEDEDLLLLASAQAELGRPEAVDLLARLEQRWGPLPRLAAERARCLGGDWQPDLSLALGHLEGPMAGEPDDDTRLTHAWLLYRQLRLLARAPDAEPLRALLREQLEADALALAGGPLGGVVRALATQMRGANEAAYAEAHAAAEVDADLADAAFACGRIAHDIGRTLPRPQRAEEVRRWLERALAHFTDATARASRSPRHHLQGRNLLRYVRQLCNVLQDLGDKSAAAAAWENEVLARNPHYGPDLQVGAQYLQWAGRFEDALRRYAQARAAGQGDEQLHGEGYCHLQLGRLRAEMGDVTGALSALDAAISKFDACAARPDARPVHLAYRAEARLARARIERDDAAAADLALAGADFALLEGAGYAALPEVLFRRWEYHQALDDQPAALADARAAVAADQDVTAAHYRRLAWSCLASATGPDAPALLAEALRAADDAERWDPQRAELCCLLRGRVHAAWAGLEVGAPEQARRRALALRELNTASGLAALDARVRAEAELAASEILAQEGGTEEALTRAEAALRLRMEPVPPSGSALLAHDAFLRSPLARFHERLAASYRRVGRDAEAEREASLARALR